MRFHGSVARQLRLAGALAGIALALAACTDSRDEVTPPDTRPPVVAIRAPRPESMVADTVSVAVDASDDTGVRSVTLLVGGAAAVTRHQPPWLLPWPTAGLPDSSYHELTAEAVDEAGNSAVSTPCRVCVRRNAAPVAAILWPEPERWIDLDAAPHPWSGAAIDPDEGALPEERLVWYVDGDSTAAGGVIAAPALAAGPHAIRFEARDAWGRRTSATCEIVAFHYPAATLPGDALGRFLCALRARDSLRVEEALDAAFQAHPPAGTGAARWDAAGEGAALRALLAYPGLRTLALDAGLGAAETFAWRDQAWAKIEIHPLAAEITLRCEGSRLSVWPVSGSAARVFLARDPASGLWRLAAWWDLHGAAWCAAGGASWTAVKRAAEAGRLCR